MQLPGQWYLRREQPWQESQVRETQGNSPERRHLLGYVVKVSTKYQSVGIHHWKTTSTCCLAVTNIAGERTSTQSHLPITTTMTATWVTASPVIAGKWTLVTYLNSNIPLQVSHARDHHFLSWIPIFILYLILWTLRLALNIDNDCHIINRCNRYRR